MQLNDEDMKALSTVNVEDLNPLTDPQRQAMGKLIQSIRAFMGKIQEADAVPAGGSKPTLVD